jgi:hypothetical protein
MIAVSIQARFSSVSGGITVFNVKSLNIREKKIRKYIPF